MEFHSSLDTAPQLKNSVLTLGSFDGLHYGHKRLIERLLQCSKTLQVPSVLITFHPHPKEVLLRDKKIPVELLTTIKEKREIIENELQIDHTVILPFTQELSQVTALNFLKQYIIDPFSPSEIVIGHDHNFGKDREGNAEFLAQHEDDFGYSTIPIDAVSLSDNQDHVVSSSLIRDLLKNGRTLDAIDFLTRPYQVSGVVKQGAQRGRTLNFPTANIHPSSENKLLPQDGIYLVYVTGENADCYGACSIGWRPTFDNQEHAVEVFLLAEPDTSLYSEKLTLHFFHRLRDELKFEQVEDLVDQMHKDIAQCEDIIQNENPWRHYQEELVT